MAGCDREVVHPTTKELQADKAAIAANSIQFAENSEIDNIKARLELTSNPNLVGHVVLLNEQGMPVMSVEVKGKVTSGGKRLTEPDRVHNGSYNSVVRSAGSDEGTYGSSGEYIFFWTTGGQYVQWNGKYLYSNQPMRLRQEPLVINETLRRP